MDPPRRNRRDRNIPAQPTEGRRTRSNRAMTSFYRDKKLITEKMKPPRRNPEDLIEVVLDDETLEKAAAVFGNYIIVKRILRNMNWRELERLRDVCRLWDDVANVLFPFQPPQAFQALDEPEGLVYEADPDGSLPPSLVLCFANKKSLVKSFPCNLLSCKKTDCNCAWDHKLADFIDVKICHPLPVLTMVNCDLPCPTLRGQARDLDSDLVVCEDAYVGGISFPEIPGVNVHTIKQIKTEDVIDRLKEITKEDRIECILVFQPNKSSTEGVIQNHIDHLFECQKWPFALGGCRVYGTKIDGFNSCQNQGDKTVTYVIFSINKKIPKRVPFDAYSNLIVNGDIDNTATVKEKIKHMAMLSNKRQFAAAFKFTCIERLIDGKMETKMIRKYMPNVPLMDCFGLGEVARVRLADDNNEPEEPITKRQCPDNKDNIFYTFSTVLVVLSWGKMKERRVRRGRNN